MQDLSKYRLEAASIGVPAKPGAPKLQSTTSTVTVTDAKREQAYSIDDGKTWRNTDASGKMVFTGLKENTQYSVITKVMATAGQLESRPSEPAKIYTKTTASDPTPSGGGGGGYYGGGGSSGGSTTDSEPGSSVVDIQIGSSASSLFDWLWLMLINLAGIVEGILFWI